MAQFFYHPTSDNGSDRPNILDFGLPDFEDEVHLEQQIDSDARSRLFVVLSNRTLWMVALVYFCFVYVQFGCLVWIPSFFKETYAMSIERASTVSFFILLPGVFASPLGGFLSDRIFEGRRKPLILLGLAVLSGASFLLSLRLSIALATVTMAVVGLMILMPDVLHRTSFHENYQQPPWDFWQHLRVHPVLSRHLSQEKSPIFFSLTIRYSFHSAWSRLRV